MKRTPRRRKSLRISSRTNATEHVSAGDAFDLPLVKQVAFIRSQSASRITWHEHEQFEVLLLLEGATAYEFAGGRTVELPGSHFLVIPPGVRHRGVYDVRKPVQLCGVMFDPRAKQAARQTSFTRTDLHWLHRQCEQGAMEACRISPELRRLVRALHQQVTTEELQITRSAALRLTLCAILLEAARQLTATQKMEPSRAVQAAIDFMEQHLSEQFQMGTVARAANCSRARLFHSFKDATGMAPNDYLQRLRINRAQSALVSAAEPITSIALRCGFSTSQYFSNVFRKYTGTTPTDFRSQCRK